VRLFVSELAQAKYVTPQFNSKCKYEKSAAVVRVLENMQNLVILRCTLLCREQQRNAERFKTDNEVSIIYNVHSHCPPHERRVSQFGAWLYYLFATLFGTDSVFHCLTSYLISHANSRKIIDRVINRMGQN